ncbi:MAG TPA: iron-containing alcohol dehydrogenase, partial [Flexilinea sp.]|nr:iron-containing alcohol dehydrogenase [Flexilinea sp.]
MKNFSFQIPTQIIFGSGTLEQLNTISLPGKKAMIITGGTSVQKYGYLDQVYKILKYRNIDHVLYDKVVPNPIRKNVMEARDIAREKKCDFFIGLGGGSSIDTAKSVAMMMTNPGDLWDYVPVGQGGKKDFTQKGFPLIAIPTTAGTGTEGNPTSVITNEITGEKVGIRCDFPVISI